MTADELEVFRIHERNTWKRMENARKVVTNSEVALKDASDLWKQADDRLRKALDEWRYQ